MRFSALSVFLAALVSSRSVLALQETWEAAGYQGADASGPQVLGYWKFDAADPAKAAEAALLDGSALKNHLTLQGATLATQGRSGGALESFPGFPVQDKRHAAVTTAKASLSPKGAFTLEMWIKPRADFAPELRCFLLDKKYVDHTDYQWQIGDADKAGLRRMWVALGFGAESKTITSPPVRLVTGAWQHVAFTYDGAGTGRFFLNGSAVGGMTLPGYGAITPGTKPLSIGDRLGSNYGGFPGFIDEVRICHGVLTFEQASMEIVSPRRVWRRLEPGASITINCTNQRRQALAGARLKVTFGERDDIFPLPEIAPGRTHPIKLNVDTALRPASYTLRARFEAGDYTTEQMADFQIAARPAPRMPVIMWGAGGDEIERLTDIGFTHFIGMSAAAGEMWAQKKALPPGTPEQIARTRQMLDDALAGGLSVVASVSPAQVLLSDPKNLRVDRSGKPYARQDICASQPEFATFFENVGRGVARAYGDHPAFTTVLVDTEVRDHNALSFNPADVENYRKFANADIPAEAVAKWGVDWTKLKGFPADRVIADDDPILKYYRWFWTIGDGWNGLHTALHKGLKSAGRRDLWTFFDPAVRQPSISGAGGQVDVLSHWTYTYPDPQRIGLCADQLSAMSEASARHQRVMKMTQLIWYRSQTAPIGAKAPGDTVAWEDHDPEAAYITIAPMHLKEALWTKLARPIQGIMYHGWQSLVPTESTSAYRYTNPSTAHVLRDLIRSVVEPLGPALMAIPDERSEVAFYESFTSQMFARRGGYGSNLDWATDVWLALQHAHVQADVLYEETLLKAGLGGRKVLVMPHCDVLPRGVVTRIQDWQKKGGKIIADEFLCPALKADVVLASFKREKKAAADKAKTLEVAAKLNALALPRKANCDNPEIILRVRRFGDALYVFAVNDRREFGSYVGQHGLVMENGLPSRGVITLAMEQANVYDLTRGKFIVPRRGEDGSVSWPVALGPCDGAVFMVLPKPLLGLKLDVPESASPGNTAKLSLQITTTQDAPTKAVVPVRLDIRDASGQSAEGSGFYAAENGIVQLDLNLAPNESPGTWEIRATELASGMEATKWMRLGKQ